MVACKVFGLVGGGRVAGWGNALCAVGEVRRTLPGCGLRRAEIGRWEAKRRGKREEGVCGVWCVRRGGNEGFAEVGSRLEGSRVRHVMAIRLE